MEIQQTRVLFIVEKHVTVNNIKISSVAQQYFCGEFMCRQQYVVVRSQPKMPKIFFRQIFRKGPNVKFHRNPSSGSLADNCEQSDRHEEGNRRFSGTLRHTPKMPLNKLRYDNIERTYDVFNERNGRASKRPQTYSLESGTLGNWHSVELWICILFSDRELCK